MFHCVCVFLDPSERVYVHIEDAEEMDFDSRRRRKYYRRPARETYDCRVVGHMTVRHLSCLLIVIAVLFLIVLFFLSLFFVFSRFASLGGANLAAGCASVLSGRSQSVRLAAVGLRARRLGCSVHMCRDSRTELQEDTQLDIRRHIVRVGSLRL